MRIPFDFKKKQNPTYVSVALRQHSLYRALDLLLPEQKVRIIITNIQLSLGTVFNLLFLNTHLQLANLVIKAHFIANRRCIIQQHMYNSRPLALLGSDF